MAEVVAMESFTSTIKMYAVIHNGIVIAPYVGTEEELIQTKTKNPSCNFIEMTLENSPMETGEMYNG